jgi:hypothetical protein
VFFVSRYSVNQIHIGFECIKQHQHVFGSVLQVIVHGYDSAKACKFQPGQKRIVLTGISRKINRSHVGV